MNEEVLHRVTYVDSDGNRINEHNEDYRFWCLGCDSVHHIRAKGDKPSWEFNGDMVKPTFSPSHLTGWHGENGQKFSENRCHSFIKDGNIQYLSDCHHDLKGKTIPLPPKSQWKYGC